MGEVGEGEGGGGGGGGGGARGGGWLARLVTSVEPLPERLAAGADLEETAVLAFVFLQ